MRSLVSSLRSRTCPESGIEARGGSNRARHVPRQGLDVIDKRQASPCYNWEDLGDGVRHGNHPQERVDNSCCDFRSRREFFVGACRPFAETMGEITEKVTYRQTRPVQRTPAGKPEAFEPA